VNRYPGDSGDFRGSEEGPVRSFYAETLTVGYESEPLTEQNAAS